MILVGLSYYGSRVVIPQRLPQCDSPTTILFHNDSLRFAVTIKVINLQQINARG